MIFALYGTTNNWKTTRKQWVNVKPNGYPFVVWQKYIFHIFVSAQISVVEEIRAFGTLWPFSDELAAVAHCFPALSTRREEHALIHNLQSRPKSDKRSCFENKKTDKQKFAEPREGKQRQMAGAHSDAQSFMQRHCLTLRGYEVREPPSEDTQSHVYCTENTTEISLSLSQSNSVSNMNYCHRLYYKFLDSHIQWCVG